MTARRASRIDTIIIHCSASPNGRPFTIADVDEWHRLRGFARDVDAPGPYKYIGYNLVIEMDGAIRRGREDLEVTAHARGYNRRALGVCLIGTDSYSTAQWASLAATVRDWRRQYDIARVIGHCEVEPKKTCPGFAVAVWLVGSLAPLTGHVFDGLISTK